MFDCMNLFGINRVVIIIFLFLHSTLAVNAGNKIFNVGIIIDVKF